MVWSEHDNRFKTLNSQLLKECAALDWTGHAGHAVSGMTDRAFQNPAEPMWVDEDDVMAVTAQSSGRTLRQLAGPTEHEFARVGSDPRRAAAMAASARLASAGPSPSSSRSTSPAASRAGSPMTTPMASEQAPPGPDSSPASSAAVGTEVAIDPEADIAGMGHQDPSTQQAEEAMRVLGSMDFADQAANLSELPEAHGQTAQHSTAQQGHAWPNQLSTAEYGSVADEGAVSSHQHQASQSLVEPLSADVLSYHHHHSTAQLAGPTAQQQPAHSVVQTPHQQLDQDMQQGLSNTEAHQQAQHAQHGPVMHSADAHESMTDADLPPPMSSIPQSRLEQQESSLGQTAAAPAAASQQDEYPMDVDPEDPAVQRYKQAEAAIAQLRSQAGATGQQTALETLAKILQVQHAWHCACKMHGKMCLVCKACLRLLPCMLTAFMAK